MATAFSPRMIDLLPTSGSVGKVYGLHDQDRRTEVLGTMIACWPDRGPTWAIRLHEPLVEGHLTVVHLHERPESKLARWFVTREIETSKRERYSKLVESRKAYDAEGISGLANPSHVEGGRYDSNEVGPWTRWAGDLDADLMVVGQDWGDVSYFARNRGFDDPRNATSLALAGLLYSVGRTVPLIPTSGGPTRVDESRKTRVFLTNALLWLKEGGLSSAVKEGWFSGDSATFLLEQIAIVQPRVVVALGQRAYIAILNAYDLPVPKGPFEEVVGSLDGICLPGTSLGTRLFGVYHCGTRVRNTVRSLVQQQQDWVRARDALAKSIAR
jgi:hypothetical protein